MVNKTSSKKTANKKDARTSPAESIERGIQLVESGDRQAAFDLFQQTVELDPNAAEAWVWLGGTSSSIDAAELAFERAYSLDPQNEEASLGLRWGRLQRTPPVASSVVAFAPAPQTVMCPNCGTENEMDDKFCVRCGQDLMRETPQQTAQVEPAALAAIAADDQAAPVAAVAPVDAVAHAPAKRGF